MSTVELVRSARSAGLDWSGVIGLRPAIFEKDEQIDPAISTVEMSAHGMDGIRQIDDDVLSRDAVQNADVVITLIAQSDIAMSRSSLRRRVTWVPFVRGLPWPGRGEASLPVRTGKRLLETRALRAAPEVWATTPRLAEDIRSAAQAVLVPAGVAALDRNTFGPEDPRFIWAGRLTQDKDPLLFVEAMREVDATGVMYGTGPLEETVIAALPSNVTYRGWARAADIWREPGGIFVGTSVREAFGRSAVEAAFAGKPTLIGSRYGCADLLVQGGAMSDVLVVQSRDPHAWTKRMNDLTSDAALRATASDHVRANAEGLTIERSVEMILRRLENLAGSAR